MRKFQTASSNFQSSLVADSIIFGDPPKLHTSQLVDVTFHKYAPSPRKAAVCEKDKYIV